MRGVTTCTPSPAGETDRGRPRAYALVAAGSALGAVLRVLAGWSMGSLLDDAWSTVIVNVAGCFAIGVVAGLAARRPAMARWWPLLGPGLLGGFTTFSAFVVLLDGASELEAALLAVVTLGLCPLAAWLGEKAAPRAN